MKEIGIKKNKNLKIVISIIGILVTSITFCYSLLFTIMISLFSKREVGLFMTGDIILFILLVIQFRFVTNNIRNIKTENINNNIQVNEPIAVTLIYLTLFLNAFFKTFLIFYPSLFGSLSILSIIPILANIICFIGLIKFKKWGIYVFTIFYLLYPFLPIIHPPVGFFILIFSLFGISTLIFYRKKFN